jgi:competence protein ComEC
LPYVDSNNNSIVIKVQYKNISVLLPGDLMAEGERDLIKRSANDLASTVLVAGHHGSRTSSTPKFLKAVFPKAVVISCRRISGALNPHPRVIQRFESMQLPIFRTDTDGAVFMAWEGESLVLETFRSRKKHTITP